MIVWLALNMIGYNIGMSIGRMMLALTNWLNAGPSPGDKPNRAHAAHNGCLGWPASNPGTHYWDPVAQRREPRYEAIGDGRFPPRRLVVDAARPMTQAEQQEKINAYFGGSGPRDVATVPGLPPGSGAGLGGADHPDADPVAKFGSVGRDYESVRQFHRALVGLPGGPRRTVKQ